MVRSVSSRTGAAYSRDTDPMTHRQPATRLGWWRLLLAALAAAAVAVLLGAGTASAVTVPVLETRVGASTPATVVVVGPHECITAGQQWVNAPPQADSVVATGVAANAGVRGAAELGGFTHGISGDGIAAINRGFGGSVVLSGSVDTCSGERFPSVRLLHQVCKHYPRHRWWASLRQWQ